ncbi:hypothetical protein B2J93_9617 [Marssonina coronariae]|uniref:Uncharacterized protein n=1 Tax=Diplocarpon coronariae TaxID=2795749 RepID=A0A218ZGM2_9HELO|nr:hypothetical protein B2J93_9617 [Marssonina coronariae]
MRPLADDQPRPKSRVGRERRLRAISIRRDACHMSPASGRWEPGDAPPARRPCRGGRPCSAGFRCRGGVPVSSAALLDGVYRRTCGISQSCGSTVHMAAESIAGHVSGRVARVRTAGPVGKGKGSSPAIAGVREPRRKEGRRAGPCPWIRPSVSVPAPVWRGA